MLSRLSIESSSGSEEGSSSRQTIPELLNKVISTKATQQP